MRLIEYPADASRENHERETGSLWGRAEKDGIYWISIRKIACRGSIEVETSTLAKLIAGIFPARDSEPVPLVLLSVAFETESHLRAERVFGLRIVGWIESKHFAGRGFPKQRMQ
jgi:hypothetical protein